MNLLTICLVLANLFVLRPVEALDEKDCICKLVPTVSARMVKGTPMKKYNYPWLAEIYATEFELDSPGKLWSFNPNFFKSKLIFNRHLVCAATIVNERYLLSAASCMPGEANQLDQMKVKVRGTKELISVEKIILYPNFTSELFYAHHDIALIRLKETLKFNKNTINPGCLDSKVSSFFTGSLYFAGRGSSEPVRINKETGMVSNFKPSDSLMEGEGLDKTSVTKECINNKTTNLCVKTGQSLCLGEQGSPIHSGSFGTKFVVGVASLPIAKHLEDNKTVELCTSGIKAARVHYYIDWIKESLNGGEYCTGNSKKQ